jgi:hypothetical protein
MCAGRSGLIGGRVRMITFNVVQEQHGWSIRVGEGMTTPFWSRDLAVHEANCLAAAIRRHGKGAKVIIEGAYPSDSPKMIKGLSSSRLEALLRGRWAGRPATISGPLKAS